MKKIYRIQQDLYKIFDLSQNTGQYSTMDEIISALNVSDINRNAIGKALKNSSALSRMIKINGKITMIYYITLKGKIKHPGERYDTDSYLVDRFKSIFIESDSKKMTINEILNLLKSNMYQIKTNNIRLGILLKKCGFKQKQITIYGKKYRAYLIDERNRKINTEDLF